MKNKSLYKPLIENLLSIFNEHLKTVVLFGSQARSKTVLKRDHDTFVAIDGLPRDPLKRLKMVRKAVLNIPLQVNFISKTPEEVALNLTPLLLDICVDGFCLYGEDYFEPYRSRALRALRQSGLKREKVDRQWYWRFEKTPQKDWELSWEGYRELT